MNIFYLHEDPALSAQALINKHVVKMVLESAQLLCTCHRMVDGIHYIDSTSGRRLQKWRHPDSELDEILYKSQHFNHPCSIWLRESSEHYDWLYQHFIALGQEYKKRYGKEHASITKLSHILKLRPQNLSNNGFKQPPQAMPLIYQKEDSRAAYRTYYEADKLSLGTKEDAERYFEFKRTHVI
jgi:hypothetical protein